MDFDPGECHDDSEYDSEYYESHDEMAEDNYEEGYEDGQDDTPADEVEYDDDGNAIPLVVAAGFGYHMATDELEERKLAEAILKRREGKQGKFIKVPLARRKEDKGHMTPFGRWATKVNLDPKRTVDDIEYTKEEWFKILDAEGD